MNPVMFNNMMDRRRYTNYEADPYPLNRCEVSLKNKDLWKKFHELGTEMIITKSGRRMFPSFHIQVAELDPNAYYCIFLEMVPASHCRYKYTASAGWTPAGTEEAQSPHRISLHPESPAKGDYWMSQPISFGRLKLTNTPNAPAGQVVLSSMHKYQPRIIIVKTNDARNLMWAPSTSVAFPETEFVAVTAYQNEKITQLKIDNNPFAKGFRENGQAKCKRKRANQDEDNESNTKRQRTISENTNASKDDEQISVYSSPKTLNDSSSCSSPRYSPISPKIADLKHEARSSNVSSPVSARACDLSSPLSSVNSSLLSPSVPNSYTIDSKARQEDPRMLYPASNPLAYPVEKHGNLPMNNDNYYPYSYGFNMGYYPSFYPNMYNSPVPYFYNQYFHHSKFESPKDLSMIKVEKEVKKFTDFSISTIMAK